MKNTLVLGASTNPERYSNIATLRLLKYNYPVYPVGLRAGKIAHLDILTNQPVLTEIDTVTLYVGPKNQPVYYDYILNVIKPKRIIFNPGTENPELAKRAQDLDIETEEACTLVLLATNAY